jgi:hypothetical protein
MKKMKTRQDSKRQAWRTQIQKARRRWGSEPHIRYCFTELDRIEFLVSENAQNEGETL